MDVKVYQKEEVPQPQGIEYVYVPNVIDIIPELETQEDTGDVTDNVWNLEQLKYIADVKIENNVLIINSDRAVFEDGVIKFKLNHEQILNCATLADNSKELLEQQCALATIWQKGLDPLDLEDGIRWSEAILGELSCLQLMQDIIEAVAKVTTSVKVVFDTIEDENGQQFLSYRLLEVV